MKPAQTEPDAFAKPGGAALRWLLDAHGRSLASHANLYETHLLVIAGVADFARLVGEPTPRVPNVARMTACLPVEPAKILPLMRTRHPELAAQVEARLARRQGDMGVVAVIVTALGTEACCAILPTDAVAAGVPAVPARGGSA